LPCLINRPIFNRAGLAQLALPGQAAVDFAADAPPSLGNMPEHYLGSGRFHALAKSPGFFSLPAALGLRESAVGWGLFLGALHASLKTQILQVFRNMGQFTRSSTRNGPVAN